MCILECLKTVTLRYCLQPRNRWTFTCGVQPVTKYNSCCVFIKPALCYLKFPPHNSDDCYHSCTCVGRCVCIVHQIFLFLQFVLPAKNQGSSVCRAVNGISSNGMQLRMRNVQREGLHGESNRLGKLSATMFWMSRILLFLSGSLWHWQNILVKRKGSW